MTADGDLQTDDARQTDPQAIRPRRAAAEGDDSSGRSGSDSGNQNGAGADRVQLSQRQGL
jgi:hypothetical protein